MKITDLFIDEQVQDSPVAAEFESRLGISGRIVSDPAQVFQIVSDAADSIQKGKQVLYLTRNKSSFIRECPGTRSYLCCGYKILHIGTFCTMDCSYCILQVYFHPPLLQFFVNQQDMIRDIDREFAKPVISRIGTGEFTDSMIWEYGIPLSELLIPLFGAQSRAVLELKTKTTQIQRLKYLSHNRKTICAWSLNTERVIRDQERHTASLNARLQAAETCQSWGYPLAFHFDPVVLYEGCEAEYRHVIHRLFNRISADNIVWISIGTFRFIPELKTVIQKRFTDSTIVYGEFITGLDGKMRYFKPLRLNFYQKMVSWIRELAPNVLVYFCMESEDIWKRTMGFTPEKYGGLSRMLDLSAQKCCGLVL
jgi:spore photoproduct lyase